MKLDKRVRVMLVLGTLLIASFLVIKLLYIKIPQGIVLGEPYARRTDCHLEPPSVICVLEICNAGTEPVGGVVLTMDVLDAWGRRWTKNQVIGEISPRNASGSGHCKDAKIELANESIGGNPRLRLVASYDGGVSRATLVNFS